MASRENILLQPSQLEEMLLPNSLLVEDKQCILSSKLKDGRPPHHLPPQAATNANSMEEPVPHQAELPLNSHQRGSSLWAGFMSLINPLAAIVVKEKHPKEKFPKEAGPSQKDPWEIPFQDIRDLIFLGSGSQGAVFVGEYRKEKVVVKKVENVELCPEANYIKNLRHPNLVRIMGVCTKSPAFCIVMEYCSGGSLYDYIHKGVEILPPQVMGWCKQIGAGMQYLHAKKIIHRDLKSLNVLICEDDILKVSDFGMSRQIGETSTKMSFVGTVAWMAPEMIRHEPCSEKIDVWSYGVLLWELLMQERPYKNVSTSAIIWGVGSNNLHLPIPASCPVGLKVLMEMCWQLKPENRPTFRQILLHLDLIAGAFLDIPSKTYLMSQDYWRGEIEVWHNKLMSDGIPNDSELIRRKEEELKHAQDVRLMYEQKLHTADLLYKELKSCKEQLEAKELELQRRERMLHNATYRCDAGGIPLQCQSSDNQPNDSHAHQSTAATAPDFTSTFKHIGIPDMSSLPEVSELIESLKHPHGSNVSQRKKQDLTSSYTNPQDTLLETTAPFQYPSTISTTYSLQNLSLPSLEPNIESSIHTQSSKDVAGDNSTSSDSKNKFILPSGLESNKSSIKSSSSVIPLMSCETQEPLTVTSVELPLESKEDHDMKGGPTGLMGLTIPVHIRHRLKDDGLVAPTSSAPTPATPTSATPMPATTKLKLATSLPPTDFPESMSTYQSMIARSTSDSKSRDSESNGFEQSSRHVLYHSAPDESSHSEKLVDANWSSKSGNHHLESAQGTQAPSTIPFCNAINLFTCDEHGRTIEIDDISIIFPRGAIPAGITAHVELGIALYGPFSFPDEYQPVSPIIWLCIREKFDLLLPMTIKLPHMVMETDRVELKFSKADHLQECHDSEVFFFKHVSEGRSYFTSFTENSAVGYLQVKHCCLYCIEAKVSQALSRSRGYCLHTFLEERGPSQCRILHVCTFCLNQCFKTLAESYPEDKFTCCNRVTFKFSDDVQELTIEAECDEKDKMKFVTDCKNKIKAADIAFWKTDPKQQEFLQLHKIYPPAISYSAFTDASMAVVMTFKVKTSKSEFFTVNVMRQFNRQETVLRSISQSANDMVSGTFIKGVDVNFICNYLCDHSYLWQEIGLALNFRKGELENIQSKKLKNNLLLYDLFSEWTQWPTSGHPSVPTLESLCDALRSKLVKLGAVANSLYEMRNFLPSVVQNSYSAGSLPAQLLPPVQLSTADSWAPNSIYSALHSLPPTISVPLNSSVYFAPHLSPAAFQSRFQAAVPSDTLRSVPAHQDVSHLMTSVPSHIAHNPAYSASQLIPQNSTQSVPFAKFGHASNQTEVCTPSRQQPAQMVQETTRAAPSGYSQTETCTPSQQQPAQMVRETTGAAPSGNLPTCVVQ